MAATATPRIKRGMLWMSHLAGNTSQRYPTDGRSGGQNLEGAPPYFLSLLGADKPGRRLFRLIGFLCRVAPAAANTITIRDAELNEIGRCVVAAATGNTSMLLLPRSLSYGTNQVQPRAGASEFTEIGIPVWDAFTIQQSDSSCHLETFFSLEFVSAR